MKSSGYDKNVDFPAILPQKGLVPFLEAIASEPGTGVALITADGHTHWINQHGTKIFLDEDARPADMISKHWSELFPERWVQERIKVLNEVASTGQPVLLRTLWQGRQQLSWISPIPSDSDSDSEENHPQLFLVITRRVSEDDIDQIPPGDYRIIESSVVRLGPLNRLTNRELEVLALIGRGMRIIEIADVLHRSPKTIEHHRTSIGKKLGEHDRVRLAEIARKAGLSLRDIDRTRI